MTPECPPVTNLPLHHLVYHRHGNEHESYQNAKPVAVAARWPISFTCKLNADGDSNTSMALREHQTKSQLHELINIAKCRHDAGTCLLLLRVRSTFDNKMCRLPCTNVFQHEKCMYTLNCVLRGSKRIGWLCSTNEN